MAKKSRRVRKKERRVRLSPTQMELPGEGGVAGTPVATVPARRAPKADLGEEYRYVIADLKRIGIIAVAMLAVLIVLALLLT